MAGWQDYDTKEIRALRGISSRAESPPKDMAKNITDLNQSVRYMSQMMGIMQGGIDDANKDIIQKIKDAINDLLIIFGLGGGDTLSFDWGSLKVIFDNFNKIFHLPDFFNFGSGGINLLELGQNFWNMLIKPFSFFTQGVNGFVQGLFEQLFNLLEGIPFIGGFIESIANALNIHGAKAKEADTKAVDAKVTAVVSQNQVNYVTEIINVRSGRPFWESGPDPTGDPSFPFNDLKSSIRGATLQSFTCGSNSHTHSAGSISITSSDDFDKVTVTSTNSPWGMIRFGGTSKKKVVTWIGLKTGTVTGFFMDLYKMAPDGTFNFVQSSDDQQGFLGGTLSAAQTTFPSDTVVDLGDVYAVQFRMNGTGSVVVPASQQISYGFLPNFVPSTYSGARNGSTTPVPVSIVPSTMASMYNFLVPWFSLGMDLNAKPTLRYFTDNFDNGFKPGCTFFMPFKAAGNKPQIDVQQFSYNRSTGQDGYGGLAEPQPLITDNWFCEFRLPGQNDHSHGMYIGTSDGNGMTIIMGNIPGLTLNTVPSADWQTNQFTQRYSDSTIKGAGLWRVEFTIADRKLKFFKNNVQVKEIIDTGNFVPTGPGKRFFGPVASRFSLAVSYNVDDFTFGDLQVAA